MKLFCALALCVVIVFGPSAMSALQSQRINTANIECEEYQDSVSNETMFALSVEAYQNLWGKLVKFMAKVEDNKVRGWEYKYTVNKDWGFSCTVWENAYNENTYAMVLSGTDDFIGDIVGTYLPMVLSEEPCAQLKSTVSETIDMKNHDINRIDRLYIAGYSLGGYLSNYLATELVDASNGYDSSISVRDISSTLTIDNVKCFSFAAPGLYAEKIDLSVIHEVVESAGNLVNKITDWTRAKLDRDANGDYDNNIINIKNSRDPVANLFIAPDNFKQIGKIYNVDKPGNPPLANIPLIGGLVSAVVDNTGPVGEFLFHAPDTYFKCIDLIAEGKYVTA